jgi:hypothetical protein
MDLPRTCESRLLRLVLLTRRLPTLHLVGPILGSSGEVTFIFGRRTGFVA